MIGKTIAHYEILDRLGRGGMGEVYRARDGKLDREVALKVLPPEMADNPERMARLQREAKLLASLNHPNIAAIHGVEESGGKVILVMELAGGEELGARIAGGLPREQALELARQIAEGLEEAHAKGVVHRDLKPANIKVSPEGRVKILDFGLARAFTGDADPEIDSALSPTITAMHTMAGTIIGTAAYMSPEQARGITVDKRADIFAFGAILFEMLTGRQLFDGSTVSDKLASILKSEPDWDLLPGDTPPRLRELLARCLAKRRRDRMQDVGDVRIEIERILAGDTGVAAASGRRGLPPVPVLLGAAALAVLVGFGAWTLGSRGGIGGGAAVPRHLSLTVPADLRLLGYLAGPDGRVGLVATPRDPATPEENVVRLYLRDPASFALEPVPGSESLLGYCFSPDGRWLAMVAPERSAAGTVHLWKVPADLGTPPLEILPWPAAWNPGGLHWLRDGDLVAPTGAGELVRIPMDGRPPGKPVELGATAGGFDFQPEASWASALPDGVHLLATIETWDENGYAKDIYAADVNTGEVRLVLENGAYPRWLDPGILIFSRGTSVLAVRFDTATLEVRGGMTAVADGLRTPAAWSHGEYGISRDGDLYFRPGGLVGQHRSLAFTDRRFRDFKPWSEERFPFDEPPAVSPDGRWVAAVLAKPDGTFETWLSRLDRPGFRRFASEPGRDVSAGAWTPDGSHLIMQSFRPGDIRILAQPVDGSDGPRTVFAIEDEQVMLRPSATADEGRTLLVNMRVGGRSRVAMLPFAGDGSADPATLVDDATSSTMSPDGGWLLYESEAGGQPRIQVRRWLGEGRLGPEFQVSSDMAQGPRWYRAGPDAPLEIWYFHESGMWSVRMTPGTEPDFGKPVLLAENREETLGFDILPDGRILARMADPDERDPGRLDVILGWADSVRDRLGSAP